MRLDKYLADMGIGTRSELKKIIRAKRVTVDGEIIRDPGFSVREDAEVLLDGAPVIYESFVCYMLNKPVGVISATKDGGQQTVLDLIRERQRTDLSDELQQADSLQATQRTDLFPVGRLDKDTEGLLLITNDGQLAHRLLSPKKHVEKQYYARIAGAVTDADVRAFAEGLAVDEEFTALPANLEILSSGETSEVLVTICEGKYHQIKRMFHAVGKEVLYLKRLSMGGLTLDESLAPGEYRRLTEEELALLER